jgi:hypothetical protein
MIKSKIMAKLIMLLRRIDVIILCVTLISLAIRRLIPPYINYNSPNDDSLGVSLADSLLHGKWLGGWNVNTLAKPPGYSFYLAVIHFTYITPTMFTHTLYLCVSLYFVHVLLKLFSFNVHHNRIYSRGLYLFLALNPIVLGGPFSRIYRVNLDTVFSMLFAVILLDIARRFIRLKQMKKSLPEFSAEKKAINLLASCLGLDYAGMVMLRSEAYWELYALFATIMIFGVANIHKIGKQKNSIKSFKIYVGPILLCVVCATLPIFSVQIINQHVYGVSEVEDYYSGSFARAYKDLEGVVTGRDARPFITIAKGQRQAVYEVSPTFATMKNKLEIPPNTGWNAEDCNALKVCDEAGVWFPWALRDAAMATGQIDSAGTFQLFFQKISNEVEMACRNGSLNCDGSGFGVGVKNLALIPTHQVLDSAFRILDSIFQYSPVSEGDRPTTSTDQRLLTMWHSVMYFNYVTTADGNNEWISLPNYLNFSYKIYVYLSYAGFLMLILFFILRKRRQNQIPVAFIIFVSAGLAIYVLGLALVEVSTGFPIGTGLYALPIFPNLLMGILTGTVALLSNFPRAKEIGN